MNLSTLSSKDLETLYNKMMSDMIEQDQYLSGGVTIQFAKKVEKLAIGINAVEKEIIVRELFRK
jgi:hypothetical protein